MFGFLLILCAVGFSIFMVIIIVKRLSDVNDWIKAPMTEEDLAFAKDCNIFGGDETAIMADQLKTKQIMYMIKTTCIEQNEGFTFSLSQENDYVKFMNQGDFERFADALMENDIPYYAYKISRKHRERPNGMPDVYATDYFVKVAEENAEAAYALFSALELYGSRYRYYTENGEEYYEVF